MYWRDCSSSGEPLGRGPKATSLLTWSNARWPENSLLNVSGAGGAAPPHAVSRRDAANKSSAGA